MVKTLDKRVTHHTFMWSTRVEITSISLVTTITVNAVGVVPNTLQVPDLCNTLIPFEDRIISLTLEQ